MFVHTCKLQDLKSEHPEVAKDIEKGDYLSLHINSFCSNTGQGGYETLCAIEADLIEYAKFHGDVDVLEVSTCSDAGSGYKSTTVLLALRDSKEHTGVKIKYQHFNASGEGKRSETDGENAAIKAHRRAAMRAGKPYECTTPEREVMAQQYNGGLEGAIARVLDISYDNEVFVRSWGGIQALHDFEHLSGRRIKSWRSYRIGPGKVHSAEWLDSLYSCPDGDGQALQGSTGTEFATVDCEEGGKHIGPAWKFVKSSTRKKKERLVKLERAAAADARRARRVAAEPGKVPGPRRSSRKRKRPAKKKKESKDFICPATETLEPSDGASSKFAPVEMGHGLNNSPDSSNIDPAAARILEEQYQCGVAKESNRKGVFDMHQECVNRLPSLLVPDVIEIGSWLSSRHQRAKDGKSEANSSKRKARTEAERKQLSAGSLSNVDKRQRTVNDEYSRRMFRNKYLGVLLAFFEDAEDGGDPDEDDIDVRIVADVVFDEGIWWARTDHALQSATDPNAFVPAESDEDDAIVDIRIDSGSKRRPALGTYIRGFNDQLYAYWYDADDSLE